MKDVLSVSAMRQSDAATIAGGTPGRELMRRAGEALFQALPRWPAPVAVVCGKGNNAGDGYVLASLLREAGYACRLLLQDRIFSPDGGYWFDRCRALEIPVSLWQEISDLRAYGAVVDCIYGTGFHGQVTGEAARIISLINQSGAFVVSADINSGLNGDNGLAELAVRSDLTVSVGAYQPGHFLNQAGDWMKTKTACEIGITPAARPYHLLERQDLLPLFPPRPRFSNKGTYGTVALIGGSLKYSGAIRLAGFANGAMRSGAGVVRIGAPASLCPLLVPAILESTLFPLSDREGSLLFSADEFQALLDHTRAAAFGMGIGNSEETQKALAWLLTHYAGTLIIDADGLNALAALGPDCLKGCLPKIILTPHPGEFARLTGRSVPEILADPIDLAESSAAAWNVVLLLKGSATVITDGQETLITDRGCPGMATAGSGDVLSGILAALCAGSVQPPASALSPLLFTAAAAAWINGRAGELAQEDLGAYAMVAGDTVRALPRALREICGGADPSGEENPMVSLDKGPC